MKEADPVAEVPRVVIRELFQELEPLAEKQQAVSRRGDGLARLRASARIR